MIREAEHLNIDFKPFFEKGRYVLGEEVEEFENEFSKFIGTRFGIGVASGTDALFLSMKCMGIGKGDEVIVPALTAMPTVNAIIATGAKPRFADIDPRQLNIDCSSVKVTKRCKAIIPVHLYGNPCDMSEVKDLNLPIIEDCCQAHGAEYMGKKVGSFGMTGSFSFYPTKNLGGYGDGGMITTDMPLNHVLRVVRNCGLMDRQVYNHILPAYNSRLDEMQAYILRKKLELLPMWNAERIRIAEYYTDKLKGLIQVPLKLPACMHVYHQYVIMTDKRDELRTYLSKKGISTEIHYPQLCSKQSFFKNVKTPNAEQAVKEILSLPIHPFMKIQEITEVAESIREFFEGDGDENSIPGDGL